MRRYDLDNLRVLLFLLLIIYHAGMFFSPWSFHLKNNETIDWIIYPMLFINQWRLPLLFVISGMGTAFAFRKRSLWLFLAERNKRLLLPFLFGMFFIVPPQVYLERLVNNEFAGTYITFLSTIAFQGVYPAGNMSWHHLWFILYLLIYAVLLAPVFYYIAKHPGAALLQKIKHLITTPAGIVFLSLIVFLPEYLLKPLYPSTHGLVKDYYNLTYYALFYLSGFLFAFWGDAFKESVQRFRRYYFSLGIVLFTSMLCAFQLLTAYPDTLIMQALHFLLPVLTVFNVWSWILTFLGYSSSRLNISTSVTTYANESVYPLYILHQTVLLAIGFLIYDLSWNVYLKIGILISGTLILSLILFEFGIRRMNFMRTLFGLKQRKKTE